MAEAEAAAREKADAKAARDAAAAERAAKKERAARERAVRVSSPARRPTNRQTPIEALTKSVLRTAGTTITRELLRGVMGSLKKR